MPSTLFRVKAVPRISVFCKHGVTIRMSFFYRQSLKLRDIVLSVPITTRTTSAFSFHSFPNSIRKSWYLCIFSCLSSLYFGLITFQVGLFAWQLIDLFATLSGLFRYLFFAGANDVCDTFNIFVLKPATWSFTGFVNAILY